MKPDKIRSVQFIDAFFPTVDGVIQTVHNYASILNRNSFSCVVAPRGKTPYRGADLPYKVMWTSSMNLSVAEYRLPTPGLDKNLNTFLNIIRPDIFHAHTPFNEGKFAVKYAKKLGIPCIATFHSKYYDDVMHIIGSKPIAKMVVADIVNLYKRMDSVWACSDGTAETLRSYGYKGDIFIMDNGSSFEIPREKWPRLKEKAAHLYGFSPGKKNILFVGHLIWHKNLKLILDAFRELTSDSDDYRLIIAGEGYDGDAIKAYAEGLGLPPGSVRFIGKVSDRELLGGLYLNGDIFFFPSVYDNSPLVVREAASMGVPSLLTEESNAAEAVVKDVSGFTAAENTEAMCAELRRILTDDALRARVAARAEIDIPQSWEEIVERVRYKYAEVIDEYNFRHKKG